MRTWTENGTYTFEHKGAVYSLKLRGAFSRYKDGEDADGNRGWWVTDCDNVDVVEIDPTPETQQLNDEILNAFFEEVSCDEIDWEGGPEE